jgi:hypothetical protein
MADQPIPEPTPRLTPLQNAKRYKTMTATRLTSPDRPTAALYAPRRFNKRSRQRFTADRTADLRRFLGREPSYAEKIIISRICAIEFELRKYDSKLDAGEELSGHALRARLAAETRLRLDLAALSPAVVAPAGRTMADARRQVRDAAIGPVDVQGLAMDPAAAYKAMCEGIPPR